MTNQKKIKCLIAILKRKYLNSLNFFEKHYKKTNFWRGIYASNKYIIFLQVNIICLCLYKLLITYKLDLYLNLMYNCKIIFNKYKKKILISLVLQVIYFFCNVDYIFQWNSLFI